MSCPSQKLQYDTHGEALDSRNRRRRPALFAYRCGMCGKWHLTSKRDSAKRGAA